MKSRRLMPDIGVPPASALPVYRTLNLPQKGRQILGPDLNCSESGRALRQPHQRIARHTIGQEAAALRDFGPAFVRFGSKADIPLSLRRCPLHPRKRTSDLRVLNEDTP